MFWLVYVPDTIMGAERNNLELPIIGNSVASETQRMRFKDNINPTIYIYQPK